MKISLSNFMLSCVLILFVVLYLHQRNRNNKLERRITAITAPLNKQIGSAKLAIQNRRSQLTASKLQLQPGMDVAQLYRSLGAASEKTLQFHLPIGDRRQLENIRNLQLKINRDEQRLESLDSELKQILDPTAR